MNMVRRNISVSIAVIFCVALVMACSEKPQQQEVPPEKVFQNKAHELVYNMVQKVGDMEQWKQLNNVVYDYTYRRPDSTEDISKETYVFEGEKSVGAYSKHEILQPGLQGTLVQGYDGTKFWATLNGEELHDEESIKTCTFMRKTNFYWLTMMPKLLDPGISYKWLREDKVGSHKYDVVSITFERPQGEKSDIYHLYINQETGLIDQFLFTVIDFNVVDKPLLMLVEYEHINGLMVPTNRKYTMANWEGEIDSDKWTQEIATNIKFDQEVDPSLFAVDEAH